MRIVFTSTKIGTLFLVLQFFETFVLTIASGSKCPLSCRCQPDTKKPDYLAVSCTDLQTWNTIPILPNKTIYLNIIANKMSVVQRSLFKDIGGESLRTLKLILNDITFVHPNAFELYTKLEILSLEENKLDGLVDNTVLKNTMLTELDLDKNSFSAMPWQNICFLKKLQIFNITSNKLTSAKFHQCFLQLNSLYAIGISNNPIGQIQPEDFRNLNNSNITSLYMAGIGIKTVTKEHFQYLRALTFLDIQNNKLTSFSEDVFRFTPHLRYLHLARNHLGKVPDKEFSGLFQLRILDLRQNGIRNCKLGLSFKKLRRLEQLDLSHNNIKFLTNDSFSNLNNSDNFKELIIMASNLKIIEPGTFSPLANLETLNIAENLINASTAEKALYGFSTTYGLQKIVIDKNNFADLTGETFQYLGNTSILYFKVRKAQIQVIYSDTFKYFPQLQYLYIRDNQIREIRADAFKHNTDLIKIDMKNNKMSVLPDAASVGLQNLKKFVLILNYVGKPVLKPDTFVGYFSLEYLDLQNNDINTIAGNAFRNLKNLTTLLLGHNLISHVEQNAFAGLAKLRDLRLNQNHIVIITVDAFAQMVNLQSLDLTGNSEITSTIKHQIVDLLKPLKQLTDLRLIATGLQSIPKNLFRNLSKLTSLSLESNQISELDPDLLKDQSKLRVLTLKKNNIQSIGKAFLDRISHLEELDISRNPFQCDCDLMWFTNWIRTGTVYVSDLNLVSCKTPRPNVLLENTYLEEDCMSFQLYFIYWSLLLCFGFTISLVTTLYRLRWYLWYENSQ